LSYQWKKNGTDIGGATTSSYTTPAATTADNGAAFRCVVSNSAGTAISNPAALTILTYSVSGTVTSGGAGLAGAAVSAGAAPTSTNSAGAYTITGLANGSYTLSASKSGYSFSSASIAVTVNGGNITGKNFTAVPVGTYSISGSVLTGAGTGVSGVNISTGAVSNSTDSSGAYTIAGLSNGSYTLMATKIGYSFSPGSIAVAVNGANISGRNFIAFAAPVYHRPAAKRHGECRAERNFLSGRLRHRPPQLPVAARTALTAHIQISAVLPPPVIHAVPLRLTTARYSVARCGIQPDRPSAILPH